MRLEPTVPSQSVRSLSSLGVSWCAGAAGRQPTLLVVDDDEVMSKFLTLALQAKGYRVWSAASGAEALEVLEDRGLPDLALMDVEMPEMDGFQLGATVQRSTDLPIIMVSGNDDSRTISKAIDEIADDYVCKPVDMPILLARIKRVLMRRGILLHPTRSRIEIDDRLEIEPGRRTAIVGGHSVRLSKGENRLLLILLRSDGRTLGNNFLRMRMQPQRDYFDEGALRTMIYRLRQKIEPKPTRPRYVITDRGVGYHFGVARA